jgi:hypothetical protein
MGKMKKVIGALTLKGVGGQMAVDEHWVTIHRKGTLAKVNQGLKGEKRIPLKNITAVQIKKPGLTNGYIQFSLAGGNESTRGVFGATKDENSVMFTSRQAEDAYAICNYIEHYIIHGVAPTEVSIEEIEPSTAEAPPAPVPPAPVPPPPPPSVPAGWYPDPYRRHEHRYFDGTSWTEHVSDQGVQSIDKPDLFPGPPS